jgi:hypothetical protein
MNAHDLVHRTTEAPDHLSVTPASEDAAPCSRLGRPFKGCKFEARYDSEPSNGAGLTSVKGFNPERIERLLIKRTYVRDVCVTCGKVIERGNS